MCSMGGSEQRGCAFGALRGGQSGSRTCLPNMAGNRFRAKGDDANVMESVSSGFGILSRKNVAD